MVEDYLVGKISISKTANELGINRTTIRLLVHKYKIFGSEQLITNNKNSCDTLEIKL